jgi:hypothetical protein
MEFTSIKCIYLNKYDELQRMFGYDKNKILTEVEKFLGKKLARPVPAELQ